MVFYNNMGELIQTVLSENGCAALLDTKTAAGAILADDMSEFVIMANKTLSEKAVDDSTVADKTTCRYYLYGYLKISLSYF